LNSSFFASVLAGIERSATEEEYHLIIATSPEKVEKEKANARNLFHKRVDGLIVPYHWEQIIFSILNRILPKVFPFFLIG
jgi:DNA-binding LacI/PurR family transcriptional regulator